MGKLRLRPLKPEVAELVKGRAGLSPDATVSGSRSLTVLSRSLLLQLQRWRWGYRNLQASRAGLAREKRELFEVLGSGSNFGKLERASPTQSHSNVKGRVRVDFVTSPSEQSSQECSLNTCSLSGTAPDTGDTRVSKNRPGPHGRPLGN